MLRTIIKIDESKCNGCGACAAACHEGAIEMIDGVAKLTREDYCDGLGNCLPACPTGAISFEEREAPAYDEAAVQKAQAENEYAKRVHTAINNTNIPNSVPASVSQLRQWPVQIKLVPVNAPYFDNANLLIAAEALSMLPNRQFRQAANSFHGVSQQFLQMG